MPRIEHYFDAIDHSRAARARRLSELLQYYDVHNTKPAIDIASKAIVVLCYAEWEGFYNECVDYYFGFLSAQGSKIRDIGHRLMLCSIEDRLKSLRDRNYSTEAKIELIDSIFDRMNDGFDNLNTNIVRSQSNLNFKKIKINYSLIGIELGELEEHRNRLDKELVLWRHSVAHGDTPNLDRMDAREHISFTSKLLLIISDGFQQKMLSHLEVE